METWEEFAVVTGGAAAALTGLLFVAVSIRIEVIAASTDLRSRAAQTLTLFLTITLVALLFAIPDQPEWLFGSELMVLAVAGGVTLLILDRRAQRHRSPQPVARLLDVLSPNVLTMTLIGVGGLLTTIGVKWGLYLEVPAVIAALIGGVIGAWLFMMRTANQIPSMTTYNLDWIVPVPGRNRPYRIIGGRSLACSRIAAYLCGFTVRSSRRRQERAHQRR